MKRQAVSGAMVAISLVVVVAVAGVAGWYFLLNTQNSTTSTSTRSGLTTVASPTSTFQSSSTAATSTASSASTRRYSIPYNAATKTVRIYLEVDLGVGSDVNFNGTNFGALQIYVPAGSTLNVTLRNFATIPHNVMLVQNTTGTPNNPDVGSLGNILFGVGANSSNYKYSGYIRNSAGSTYSNIAPGKYWLACGILTHAGDGLWVSVVAASSVTSPYVIITSPALRPAGFG